MRDTSSLNREIDLRTSPLQFSQLFFLRIWWLVQSRFLRWLFFHQLRPGYVLGDPSVSFISPASSPATVDSPVDALVELREVPRNRFCIRNSVSLCKERTAKEWTSSRAPAIVDQWYKGGWRRQLWLMEILVWVPAVEATELGVTVTSRGWCTVGT